MPGLSHGSLALMADTADHNFRRRITEGVLQKYFLDICFTEIFKTHRLCSLYEKKAVQVSELACLHQNPTGSIQMDVQKIHLRQGKLTKVFLWLLTEYFHAEYQAVKKRYFSDWGLFFLTFTLQTNTSSNYDGCTSRLPLWRQRLTSSSSACLCNKGGLTNASQF